MSTHDQYAVIGHGIGYSRSPRIHAAFAAQCEQAMHYGLIDVPPDQFTAQVRAFFAAGGRGLNVTVPFKQQALALCDVLGERAREAGAVNTLAVQADGRVLGDNTDGTGLVRDLELNLGCRLHGARVLMLGAGGAARGAVGPLLRAGVARLDIANRTVERARELAAAFAAGGPVHAHGAAADGSTATTPYDLIINATAASHAGELPPLPAGAAGPGTLCYDMGYSRDDSVFARWARSAHARPVDGLGMLVEQAAESFCLWRGMRPRTGEILAQLRAG